MHGNLYIVLCAASCVRTRDAPASLCSRFERCEQPLAVVRARGIDFHVPENVISDGAAFALLHIEGVTATRHAAPEMEEGAKNETHVHPR